MSRVRKLLLRLLIGVLTTALAVGGIELGVRMLDPYGVSDGLNAGRYVAEVVRYMPGNPRVLGHRPNVRVDLRGFAIRTDAHGLRGPERALPKPAGTRRLLFVGDSITFGWGVEEEDTFVAVVEHELRARLASEVEAVNAGHLFHDTVQERAVLEQVGVLYEPDLVLLVFVENDVVLTSALFERRASDHDTDARLSDEARSVARTAERLRTIEPYLPYSHALLRYLLVNKRVAGQTGSRKHAEHVGLDLSGGLVACKAAIAAMRDGCAARGVRFGVLDTSGAEPLAEYCASVSVPYASIQMTADELADDVRNSAADPHPNPQGHRYIARHVLEALDALELVAGW